METHSASTRWEQSGHRPSWRGFVTRTAWDVCGFVLLKSCPPPRPRAPHHPGLVPPTPASCPYHLGLVPLTPASCPRPPWPRVPDTGLMPHSLVPPSLALCPTPQPCAHRGLEPLASCPQPQPHAPHHSPVPPTTASHPIPAPCPQPFCDPPSHTDAGKDPGCP